MICVYNQRCVVCFIANHFEICDTTSTLHVSEKWFDDIHKFCSGKFIIKNYIFVCTLCKFYSDSVNALLVIVKGVSSDATNIFSVLRRIVVCIDYPALHLNQISLARAKDRELLRAPFLKRRNGSFNLVRNAKLVHADGNVLIAMIFIVQNVFHMCMPEGTEPVTNTRCCPIIPLKWNGQG